jgi:hypothetical protein
VEETHSSVALVVWLKTVLLFCDNGSKTTVNLSLFVVSSSSEEIPKMQEVLGSSFTYAKRQSWSIPNSL